MKRHFEERIWTDSLYQDDALRNTLIDLFPFAPAANLDLPLAKDLVLDVIVTLFQAGSANFFLFGEIALPLFWRPKLTVSARLYYLKNEQTKARTNVMAGIYYPGTYA